MLFAVRKALGADETAHCLSCHPALAHNFPLRKAPPDQLHDRFIARQPAFPVLLLQAMRARKWWAGGQRLHVHCWFRRWLRVIGYRTGHFRQQPVMRTKNIHQRLAQVPKQMPAVGNLYGVGRGLTGSFGIQTGAITDDDFRPGMGA